MKIRRLSDLAKKRILKLTDSIASTVCLLLVLRVITAINEPSTFELVFAVIHLLLAAMKVLAALSAGRADKMGLIRNLCFAGVFAGVGAYLLIAGFSLFGMYLSIFAYLSTVLTNRVFAVIRDHRVRSVIFNVIVILIAVMLALTSLSVDRDVERLVWVVVLYLIAVAGAALLHIIRISFSQIRMNVLRKILRKTFAAEIVFGLVLLIVSFSFVFVSFEEGITSYSDALWYCFAVITTIGFGDLTVTAPVSRVLSVILGIYGIIVVALVTSIIVNFYNEVKDSKDGEEDEISDK